MEGTGLVEDGNEDTRVNRDNESWSRLEPGLSDLILSKVPYEDCLRLRFVCKDWHRSALERVERNPYFVTIVQREYEMAREYIGFFVYDIDSKRLICPEYVVAIELGSPYRAVDGLIFCERPEDEEEWCVYNIHTRTKHVVPPVPLRIGRYISGMMVDKFIKPYTFKLVLSYSSGEETQIYNSASRSWSIHPNSNPNSNWYLGRLTNDDLFLSMCHKSSMYMTTAKDGQAVFEYSMEKDLWLSFHGKIFHGGDWPYVGAWNDRIFAIMHVFGIGRILVWELIDREWVLLHYARLAQRRSLSISLIMKCISQSSKCHFVSVFCEEYVMMQNWHSNRRYDCVLLNLKTREWESFMGEEAEEEYSGEEEYYGDYDSGDDF